ncbi:MAG TPA: helix-turn-helix domain-containing protein, partial [Brevibacterium sp.]|nr:helix-turn-helix domain-containing protein [Brevibacterium sp.]
MVLSFIAHSLSFVCDRRHTRIIEPRFRPSWETTEQRDDRSAGRRTMYRQTDATRRNAAQRAHAIAEAARALVTASGFSAATVKSVAARAGCSAGLIYSYFPDRDALLRSTFAHASGHELAAVTRALGDAPTAPEAVAGLVETFLTRALAGARLADALLFEALPPAVEAERLRFRADYAAALAR